MKLEVQNIYLPVWSISKVDFDAGCILQTLLSFRINQNEMPRASIYLQL